MRIELAALISISTFVSPVSAGLGSWSAETESDPFSGGERVTVTLMSSMRSGVAIFCDSAETGLTIRAIPGFAHVAAIEQLKPKLEFAIDGSLLLAQEGSTGAVGDNLAVAEAKLSAEDARKFVAAFAKAKKQIALKDGISDRPHLLPASGSTKAGEALLQCMKKQSGGASQ